MMMYVFMMKTVMTAMVLMPSVSAEHHDKTLLETNALGYTKIRPTDVAYSENYEVDHEVRGKCVNNPPPGGILAPDAQTTEYDSQCQALGACHISFTEVRSVFDHYMVVWRPFLIKSVLSLLCIV